MIRVDCRLLTWRYYIQGKGYLVLFTWYYSTRLPIKRILSNEQPYQYWYWQILLSLCSLALLLCVLFLINTTPYSIILLLMEDDAKSFSCDFWFCSWRWSIIIVYHWGTFFWICTRRGGKCVGNYVGLAGGIGYGNLEVQYCRSLVDDALKALCV